MSDKRAKLIRKQLRTIVQEMLAETVTKELADSVYNKVSSESRHNLEQMAIQMDKVLGEMSERTKSTQDLITRAVNANLAANVSPMDIPNSEASNAKE
jgi:hypothetical protein